MMRKSPFPTGFLKTELFYSGAWQDITADTDQAGVSISHGARSESSTADVSDLSFTLTNQDGKYSPRNPTSPRYGLVGRNTPARATVALGAPWLDLTAPGSRATTPDAAALDITGDIDIRWWGERDSWTVAADLPSKWNTTGNQRSWLLRAEADGTLTLFWSADGTAALNARSTIAIPAWAGPIALRVTLDVNNGASGRTAKFYYSDSLTGTWIQLGADVVQAGTTSIFNGTASLTLGREPTSAASNTPQRVYGWQVRSSINGTIVSGRTVSDLTAGVTSFADSQGQTWTVTDGSVTNRHTLAVCEVSEWPMDWNTKGAPSVLTEVQASGVTRRLGQGAQPLDSAIYRSITNGENPNLLAYWPMEDGSDATSFGQAVGTYPLGWAGTPSLAAYDGFGGSNPLPTLGDTRMRARVRRAPSTAGVQVRHLLHTPVGGAPEDFTLEINFYASGGADLAVVRLTYQADGALALRGFNSDGTDIGGTGPVGFAVNGKDLRVSVELIKNGSNVDFVIATVDAAASGVSWSGSFTGRPLDEVRDVIVNPRRDDAGDTAFGHLTIENSISTVYSVPPAVLSGYVGEGATTRLNRLAGERSVAITTRPGGLTAMGAQRTDTFLDLMAQTAEADGGILHDDMRSIGLRYRSLHSLGSQPPVVIPYDDNLVIPFRPSDDDSLTRNRVTISRPNGTRYTAEATTGPLSTLPPPDGVGLYDTAQELNLATDDLVTRTASWRLHVGTWDEGRYPSLGVDLAHPYFLGNPVLTRQLLSLTPGDRLVITDPPPWLPPRSADVLVMGVQIEVTPLHLYLRWSCVPARPYRIGYWNVAEHRYSGEGTVLSSSRTTTSTSMLLTTPTGVTWTHADGDYDIVIGGEVMTVTDVVGTTMTVIRSVNGVVKTHAAGEAVQLAEPSFYAR